MENNELLLKSPIELLQAKRSFHVSQIEFHQMELSQVEKDIKTLLGPPIKETKYYGIEIKKKESSLNTEYFEKWAVRKKVLYALENSTVPKTTRDLFNMLSGIDNEFNFDNERKMIIAINVALKELFNREEIIRETNAKNEFVYTKKKTEKFSVLSNAV